MDTGWSGPRSRVLSLCLLVAMTGDAPDPACPNCGELDRESRGVVAGFEQPPRDYRDNLPGGRHITQRLYRCLACGLEFSVVRDRE